MGAPLRVNQNQRIWLDYKTFLRSEAFLEQSISEPTAGLLDQEGKRKRGKMLLFLEIASSRKTTKTRIISVAAAALDRMAAAVLAAGQTAATGSGNDCARTWTWPPPRSISSRAGNVTLNLHLQAYLE